MLVIASNILKTSLAIALLSVLVSTVGCLAQSTEEEEVQRPAPKQSQDLMKQSKMTVEELIKNGIIEDSRYNSDTSDYKAPTQEDMQQQAVGTQGERPQNLFAPIPFEVQGAYKSQNEPKYLNGQMQLEPLPQYNPQSTFNPQSRFAPQSTATPAPQYAPEFATQNQRTPAVQNPGAGQYASSNLTLEKMSIPFPKVAPAAPQEAPKRASDGF